MEPRSTETQTSTPEAQQETRFACAAICGVGLLGGSLGLALRSSALAERVIGVGRSAERLERARKQGAIDAWSLDLRASCAQADLIVLCGPVSTILRQIPDVIGSARSGAIVTDVGSTKRTIVERAALQPRSDVYFIGSHPMAGSEKSGADHACADLYNGATVILTPDASTTEEALRAARGLWKALGSTIVEMLPARHDRMLAAVSHLPHLAASILVAQIERSSPGAIEQLQEVAGPGFRDATRIAMGSPEMWADILTDNSAALLETIEALELTLADVRRSIETGDRKRLVWFLERAAELRKTFSLDTEKRHAGE